MVLLLSFFFLFSESDGGSGIRGLWAWLCPWSTPSRRRFPRRSMLVVSLSDLLRQRRPYISNTINSLEYQRRHWLLLPALRLGFIVLAAFRLAVRQTTDISRFHCCHMCTLYFQTEAYLLFQPLRIFTGRQRLEPLCQRRQPVDRKEHCNRFRCGAYRGPSRDIDHRLVLCSRERDLHGVVCLVPRLV